jgi:hypothetical protein
MNRKELSASQAVEISLGNEISVHRPGCAVMHLTGAGIVVSRVAGGRHGARVW